MWARFGNHLSEIELAGSLPGGWSSTERLVKSVRQRTPDGWWERAADVLVAGTDPLPVWDGAVGFMDYFGDEGAFACLPGGVVNDLTAEMFEAARQAGFDVLADFARRLVPIIQAIERFGI